MNVRLNKGFTLVELLVSIAIIAICVIGLMNLSIAITRNNVRNEIRNKAIEVLTNYVDNVTNQSFGDITVGNFTDTASEQIREELLFTYNISGSVTNPSTDEKDIIATISWTYREKIYNYNIETVVTK
jgi:prepilin-type N-terminal cleavage/methylation domain-containing protein